MTRKVDAQEPLLSAVARQLGRAAGTLAGITHKLVMNAATTDSGTASKKEPAKRASIRKSGNRSTQHGQAKPKKRSGMRRGASRAKASTRGSTKKR